MATDNYQSLFSKDILLTLLCQKETSDYVVQFVKKYIIAFPILMLLFPAILHIFKEVLNLNEQVFDFILTPFLAIFAICLYSILYKSIVIEIMKTFTFWYLFFNSIIFTISIAILQINSGKISIVIILLISPFKILVFNIFLFGDAMPFESRWMKLFMYSSVLVLLTINFFKAMKRFEHVNVIFKFIFHYDVLSILLTSLSTQMVFILKFIINVIYKPNNFMIYTTSLKKIL